MKILYDFKVVPALKLNKSFRDSGSRNSHCFAFSFCHLFFLLVQEGIMVALAIMIVTILSIVPDRLINSTSTCQVTHILPPK